MQRFDILDAGEWYHAMANRKTAQTKNFVKNAFMPSDAMIVNAIAAGKRPRG